MSIWVADFGSEGLAFEVFDKTSLTQLRVVLVAQSAYILNVPDAAAINLLNPSHDLIGSDTVGMVRSGQTNGFDLIFKALIDTSLKCQDIKLMGLLERKPIRKWSGLSSRDTRSDPKSQLPLIKPRVCAIHPRRGSQPVCPVDLVPLSLT
jgi:hypothetical protein